MNIFLLSNDTEHAITEINTRRKTRKIEVDHDWTDIITMVEWYISIRHKEGYPQGASFTTNTGLYILIMLCKFL